MCRWTVESPACILMDSVKTICRNSTLNHGKDATNQQQHSVFNVKSLETDCMFVFMYLFPPHCNIHQNKACCQSSTSDSDVILYSSCSFQDYK